MQIENDAEMDFVNAMFRAELEKFKRANEATRRKVVEIIVRAGARDWLLDISRDDDDPDIRAYADLADSLND